MSKSMPNIVMVITHDTGQHIGPYGVKTVDTPNMDRLAEEGVRFSNSFCTAPQCSPSRAGLVTGRYPHANGVMGLVHSLFQWAFKPDEKPIAKLLDSAGYQCVLFGQQHETSKPDMLGFEEVLPGRMCLEVADTFAEFLQKRKSEERPLYAQIGFFETHRPFKRPDNYQPYQEKGITVPAYLTDGPLTREELAWFQGLVGFADRGLGAVMDAVEQTGMAENTIFIYTTDHGIAFPRAKCTLYDPGIEVALLMRWPEGGVAGGKVHEEFVSNVDVLPTLLEAAGQPVLDNIQGQSFLPLLQGRTYTSRTEVFAEKTFHTGYDPMRAIRTQRYKYIHNLEINHKVEVPSDIQMGGAFLEMAAELAGQHLYVELYDLQNDPVEKENLAGKPEFAEVENDLRQRLLAWMEATHDPLLEGPVASPFYAHSLARLRGTG